MIALSGTSPDVSSPVTIVIHVKTASADINK